MSDARIEFNSDGFREILTSDGVKSLLQEAADNIKVKADSAIEGESEGFASSVFYGNFGGGRWVGKVATTDKATMIAESEHKALTNAVG